MFKVFLDVAQKLKLHLQTMSEKMSQCRPHCLTDKWSFIRCRNTTDISTNKEKLNVSKDFMEPNITAAEPFWDAEWKRSCKIRWRSGRGSKAQSDKQAGVFLLGQSFWISESWLYVKRENGSPNYQWTQWDHFLHVADILIWEEIMKAIRSSLRLSHWAHNPFVTCLPSTLKTSMFLFGFLSALSLCHYQHDTKAYKLCKRSYEPQLCMRLLLVSLNNVSIGHQGIHLLINY